MFKINFGSDFWSPFDFSTGQLLEGQLRRLAGGTVDRPEFVHSYNCRLETEGTNLKELTSPLKVFPRCRKSDSACSSVMNSLVFSERMPAPTTSSNTIGCHFA